MDVLPRLKRFGEKLIYSKNMLLGIGLASFLEALIVPIPLETLLIPLMQARRDRIFAISTVVLVACLIGALVGYAVGYFLFAAVGEQLVSMLGSQEQFEQVKQSMQSGGFWFVFSIGVAPVPFQIAMLAAGALQYSLVMFLVASGLSRALRYYGLALLVYFAGNQAQRLFERHKLWTSVVAAVLVFLAWWLTR